MSQIRSDEKAAKELDRQNPLGGFRERFYLPEGRIYLDGNSLGLLSREGEAGALRTISEWKGMGIHGWFKGPEPWFTLAERLGALAAPLVGADPDEVIATGSTTVNIHSLIATFYQPEGVRRRILADSLTFPTDIYALRSHLRLRGVDPEADLILASSSDGRTLEEDRLVRLMGPEVAVVFLPSVLYRSGQLLDMTGLTKEAHEKGALIGFDCSHSAGIVPHCFDAWGIDFAVWCGYKYLNGGPGCSAFLYINKKHFERRPNMAGWFGYVKKRQFDMLLDFEHEKAAGGWQISSPAIIGSSPLEGSLRMINEAGIDTIREQSNKMTSYLIGLVDHTLSDEAYRFHVGTPRQANRRGGHIALEREEDAGVLCDALNAQGVIVDHRPPNIIRVTPSPLYNTYHEVWRFVHILKELVDRGVSPSVRQP